MINFKSLYKIDNQDILDCFNLSFSDYSIPFKLSLKQLETKLETEDIDKELSIGAFNQHKLVGFVLHGSRIEEKKKVAYNAGTGVIPEERGQGLTRKMYENIIPTLNKNNISEVVLEVISNNVPAIKSYEAIGFNIIRSLSCFKGEVIADKINNEINITQVNNINFDKLDQIGEIKPTWQNSKETILNLGEKAICFYAFYKEKLCGYCILNTDNNRILQIAVQKKLRNKLIGSTILKHLKNRVSAPISIINIDNRFDETITFFENKNMKKVLVQNEMKLVIANR